VFATESDLLDLQRKKEGLISNYSLRIFEAEQKNLNYRVELLSKTLKCFVSSKSKKDITNCKTSERKLIMSLIRG
jgi:hypothetical protein